MEKGKNRRVFDLGLKLDLVKKIDKGEIRVRDICRIYSVSGPAVYAWIKKYSPLYAHKARVIVESKSLSKKNKEQADRIKALEQTVGQKQMRIDYLEKVIELASAEMGVSIEKKSRPKH